MFEDIAISRICKVEKGNSKYTKKYILENSGEYPVYSSQTLKEGIIGYINSFDYNCECLTWTTDGIYAGTVFYRNGKFNMTTHCGALFLIDDLKNINLKYVAYVLSLILKNYAKGEGNKRVTKEIIEKVYFKMPLKYDGDFDIEKQNKIVSKIEEIEKVKNIFDKEYKQLNKKEFEIKIESQLKEVYLGDEKLFVVDNGERIRKEDIDKMKGDIPVYSASKFDKEALGYVSDRIKEIIPKAKSFNDNVLTVNADGSVGKVFLRNEKFYANDVINVIKVLKKDILEEYLLYGLQKRLYSLGFSSWSNKLYKEKLRKISIFIPIDDKGNFDTREQKRVADKYHKIENMKKIILGELNSIIKSKVDLIN